MFEFTIVHDIILLLLDVAVFLANQSHEITVGHFLVFLVNFNSSIKVSSV